MSEANTMLWGKHLRSRRTLCILCHFIQVVNSLQLRVGEYRKQAHRPSQALPGVRDKCNSAVNVLWDTDDTACVVLVFKHAEKLFPHLYLKT